MSDDDFKPSSRNTINGHVKRKSKSKRSEVLKVKYFEVTTGDDDARNTKNSNTNNINTKSRKRQKNYVIEAKSTECSDTGDDDIPSTSRKRRLTKNTFNETIERNGISSLPTPLCNNKKIDLSDNDEMGKVTNTNGMTEKIISISDGSDSDDFQQNQKMKSFPIFNKIDPNNVITMSSRKSPISKVSPNKKATPNKKASPNKKAVKTKKKLKDITLPKKVEGFCPFCQMPFSALGVQSPDWHTMECMDLPFITESECDNGINCESTIPSHYRRYRHSELAAFRANVKDFPVIENGHEDLESISSSIVQNSSNESRIDSVSSSASCDKDKVKNHIASSDDTLEIEPLFNQGSGSSEDLFDVDTPDTPNFFLNGVAKKSPRPTTSHENEPSLNLISTVGNGFIETEKEDTKNLDDCIYIPTSNSTSGTFTSTSYNNIPKLSNSTKQTSLFSFFTSKSKKPPITKFKSESNYLDLKKENESKSYSLNTPIKNGTDPWGSLKRQTNKLTTDQPTVERNESVITYGGSGNGFGDSYKKRKLYCPFYKRIPETSITVDAFRYGCIPGCNAYILTHFHYDHYNGLTKKFQQPIYCSKITGNLVESKLKVDNKYINRLPMNQPCFVEGVELILREANHCPGAVIIFMRLPNGRRILHTGDYRAHPSMEEYPELKENKIHDLYLDTTYCNPEYAFPYQEHVIEFAVKIAQKTIKNNPTTCIICGTYTIGKERVFKAVATAINSKVCVKKDKKSIIDCLDDEELNKIITLDPTHASVHVLPMKMLNFNSLCDYLEKNKQFNSILVFEPTGWTHNKKIISLDHVQPKYSRNGITHYGIPYSEHSSFLELKRFVQFLKPVRILPTVNNGNPTSRRKMEELFAEWLKESESTSVTKQVSLTDWMKD